MRLSLGFQQRMEADQAVGLYGAFQYPALVCTVMGGDKQGTIVCLHHAEKQFFLVVGVGVLMGGRRLRDRARRVIDLVRTNGSKVDWKTIDVEGLLSRSRLVTADDQFGTVQE